jgi:hypothetical protein
MWERELEIKELYPVDALLVRGNKVRVPTWAGVRSREIQQPFGNIGREVARGLNNFIALKYSFSCA